MPSSLKEAHKYLENAMKAVREGRPTPYSINIYRDVRYYADINGTRYELLNDWETQAITEIIDGIFTERKKTKTPNQKD